MIDAILNLNNTMPAKFYDVLDQDIQKPAYRPNISDVYSRKDNNHDHWTTF